MRSLKHFHILGSLICLLLIACNTNTQPVAAKTVNTGFNDTPVNAPLLPLLYDTLSPQVREIITRLDKFYGTQARNGFSGGVLVGYKGNILYERYYGYSNRELKIPQCSVASCQLASISKTFTGAAVLYLYQRKYLDIDKPVAFYIPTFPYPAITLRMLLDHRSGLPDYTHWVPNYISDTRTPIDNEAMLELMARHKPALEFKPNTRFTYSNTNYATLARVVEVVTEMSFADFMAKYIFHPLGMYHTFVYNPAKGLPMEAAISYAYNWAREPDMFADGVYGDKGIYSTPQDMYRWDQSFYRNTLLNPSTIDLAYGPCSFERKGIKNYGLGWRMLCFPDGNKIIYHNGWWHGNNTSFYRLIKDNFTIIVLGNKFNKGIYQHAAIICNTVRGVSAADAKNFDSGE
ncbi:MAG: class A beta-lactamase-related serine hydrolase [Chitinophagia bacterium]|nr:class A beta-lactamase-related serine hydrolase [Chitinophagia bacterium]